MIIYYSNSLVPAPFPVPFISVSDPFRSFRSRSVLFRSDSVPVPYPFQFRNRSRPRSHYEIEREKERKLERNSNGNGTVTGTGRNRNVDGKVIRTSREQN